MCYLWIVAYALSLICTIKEKKATIPPIASVFILSWEFLGVTIVRGFNYVTFARISWFVLHLAGLIITLFFIKAYTKKQQIIYMFLFIAAIFIMNYIFSIPQGRMYTSFINTALGLFSIIIYILIKKDYPLTTTNFYFAFIALLADSIAVFYYNHIKFGALVGTLMYSLVIIHIVHVLILYLHLKKNNTIVLHSFQKDWLSIKGDIYYLCKQYFIPPKKKYTKRKYKKKTKNKKTHKKN